jgi:hypothetical protein
MKYEAWVNPPTPTGSIELVEAGQETGKYQPAHWTGSSVLKFLRVHCVSTTTMQVQVPDLILSPSHAKINRPKTRFTWFHYREMTWVHKTSLGMRLARD